MCTQSPENYESGGRCGGFYIFQNKKNWDFINKTFQNKTDGVENLCKMIQLKLNKI